MTNAYLREALAPPPLERAIERGFGMKAPTKALEEVPLVRRAVQQHLAAGRLPDDFAYEVTLLLDEVLTNAVVHGRGRVFVKVDSSADALLSVIVSDQSPQPPRSGLTDPEDQAGRGWDIVQALAAGRGGEVEVLTHAKGKVIRCVLPVPVRQAAARCA